VIRELVMTLYYNYGVRAIFGIKFGYRGFYDDEWEELTPKKVVDIHHLGGTILGSSRGGFDLKRMMKAITSKGVNQIFVIGGDGTHRGVHALFQEISRQHLKVAICAIPKTIDNDIPIIDKSFGFETAVEEATKAIYSGHTESKAAQYGIGLIKLMGRSAGFIAMHASLASRDVNVCLVPEFKFDLGGPRGLLSYVHQRLQARGRCTIVVAEGAGI
jgi:6-phosphofructokinase 1